MPKILRSLALLTCMALTVAFCCAQIGRVPTPARRGATPYSSISSEQTPSAKESAPSHAQAALTTVPGVVATYQNCDLKTRKAGFGKVGLGLVATQECDVQVAAGNPIVSIDISDSNGADPSPVFKNVTTKTKGDPCNPTDPLENNKGGTCEVGVGFMPADDHSTVTATLTVTFWDRTSIPITLSGSGGSAAGCSATANIFLPLHQGFEPGKIYPFAPKGMSPDLAIALYKAFGDPMRKSVVNCFYSTNNLFSYFNQFQSIYNAASGSTTVSATIGTLNFASGAQLTVETRPQIGTPTSSGTVASTPVSGPPPLSSTAAAQGAQNIQNGGTVLAYGLYPLISHQANPLFSLSAVVREGADLQKFNNTSITSTNPSTHTFVGLQSYLQYSSSNSATNSSDPAGQIFLGASYGYNLMNHTYSEQNGFGGRVNTQIAQVSAGILFSGNVRLAASRGFGPSQKYIDSTSMIQKTANDFQTWSIAIAYQSSGAGKTK
ncbi:MAG: hypothetical protein WAL56_04210 [Candidatus Sulfotelmatobacter sp.]